MSPTVYVVIFISHLYNQYQMQIHIKTLLLMCISSSTLNQPNIVNIVESDCYIVNYSGGYLAFYFFFCSPKR
jgi:hypothetical protein